MVVIVTKNGRLPHDREIAEKIVAACPDVVSVMQNVNRDRNNVILGQKTKLLFGRDHIKDTLNGLEFEIFAQSFYQVNPVQTEKLYQTAIKFANLTGEETAIDAYCGIGTISLSLAEKCRAVYGVEIVEAAIEDAKRNGDESGQDRLRQLQPCHACARHSKLDGKRLPCRGQDSAGRPVPADGACGERYFASARR